MLQNYISLLNSTTIIFYKRQHFTVSVFCLVINDLPISKTLTRHTYNRPLMLALTGVQYKLPKIESDEWYTAKLNVHSQPT
jgi:hypothetical protein